MDKIFKNNSLGFEVFDKTKTKVAISINKEKTATELSKAENLIFLRIQQDSFYQEIGKLKCNESVSTSSNLLLSSDNLLRGRLII